MTKQELIKELDRLARLLPDVTVTVKAMGRSIHVTNAKSSDKAFTLRVDTYEDDDADFGITSASSSLTYATILLSWRLAVDTYNLQRR
jgi:hypothetical protein